MQGLKVWFLETRPQFLTLSLVLAFLGTVVAWYDGYFSLWRALVAGIGLVLAHASVNTLNDYFDYKIDKINKPNRPLPSGRITKNDASMLGLAWFRVALSRAALC